MTKSDIPTPTCALCGTSGSESYTAGETAHLCQNCGTEMKYMPAGELLKSGGSALKKNNGWVMSFSVNSSELYSSQAMFLLGILILVLALSFLWMGKIGTDAALWSSGSGIILSIIGQKRLARQKKKTRMVIEQYPYWKK